MKKAFAFDDVLLEPKFSAIKSRKTIDISTELGPELTLTLPIISAPMDTVTESHMAHAMCRHGGMGVLHRYNTIEEQVAMIDKIGCLKAAAVGVTGDYKERAEALVEAGCDVLCLDVAHGHHILVKEALGVLRGIFGRTVHLMAGNVATLEAVDDLSSWGADSVRVGVGGGSICSTRIQTGHGIPTFQSVLDCSSTSSNVKIIADGGIKNSGDIVKALAAGADAVMVGSLLAGTIEAPGGYFIKDGRQYKTYRGMASVEAQIDWRGHTASVEGVSHAVPSKGSVSKILEQLDNGIRSGLSYSGVKNLEEFWAKATFVKQSTAGQFESNTHVKARF